MVGRAVSRAEADSRCAAVLTVLTDWVWREMIILGIILLIIGLVVASIHFRVIVGIVLLVVGLILAALGALGRAVGGRRHYF